MKCSLQNDGNIFTCAGFFSVLFCFSHTTEIISQTLLKKLSHTTDFFSNIHTNLFFLLSPTLLKYCCALIFSHTVRNTHTHTNEWNTHTTTEMLPYTRLKMLSHLQYYWYWNIYTQKRNLFLWKCVLIFLRAGQQRIWRVILNDVLGGILFCSLSTSKRFCLSFSRSLRILCCSARSERRLSCRKKKKKREFPFWDILNTGVGLCEWLCACVSVGALTILSFSCMMSSSSFFLLSKWTSIKVWSSIRSFSIRLRCMSFIREHNMAPPLFYSSCIRGQCVQKSPFKWTKKLYRGKQCFHFLGPVQTNNTDRIVRIDRFKGKWMVVVGVGGNVLISVVPIVVV